MFSITINNVFLKFFMLGEREYLFILTMMSSVDAAAQESQCRRCNGIDAFLNSALADFSWLSGVP